MQGIGIGAALGRAPGGAAPKAEARLAAFDADLSWLSESDGFAFRARGDDAAPSHHDDASAAQADGAPGWEAALPAPSAVAALHAVEGPAAVAASFLAGSAEAASTLLTTYTSGKGGLGVFSAFNIEIVFQGTWTAELQQDFILAAEYISSLVTGDVRNRGGIDDIRINATLSDIDGEGGVLGQAGPTGIRLGSFIPFRGTMEFDIADSEDFDAQGLFDDIVIHEMLHCLGFGTVWDLMGLTTGSIRGDNLRFDGLNAEVAMMHNFPDLYWSDPNRKLGVPVETDGGPGTAGGHWDEELFGGELMTGYIDDDNYVSAMTVGALEDMGYATIFEKWFPTLPVPQPDDLLAA